MGFKLPSGALRIINRLEANGFEAFAVGGCVRDMLMGKQPKDFDLCTNAKPEEVLEVFENERVIKTGLQHGTVTVLLGKKPYEITTYRVDGEYLDYRRPSEVRFVKNIKEDLSRRDFTINAIAYNEIAGIIDFFGGEEDIDKKIIRCVGEPDKRFNEDALRILRALRFASITGFEIEEKTGKSIHKNRNLLRSIASERINIEFSKMLQGEHVQHVLTEYADVIAVFIPEIEPMFGFSQHSVYHHLDVWQHTVLAVALSESDRIVRITAFFHDIGKPSCFTTDKEKHGHFYGHAKVGSEIAETILKRLKFDNVTVDTVKKLVLYHDTMINPENKSVKRWLNKIGEDNLLRLLEVQEADTKAHATSVIEDRLQKSEAVKACIENIINENQCFSLKNLAVNGDDLLKIGFNSDEKLGITLNRLLKLVLEDQLENEKSVLLEAAKKWKN
ncbi:MAG: CCA tRNA nucleotidyltransferase [Bacillota bacterium]|nr:CCA tRNA nucleotidyltransferase [Bacillota bacterium]